MYKTCFILLFFISTLSYANNDFTYEIKSIYKKQYELINTNLHLENKIEKSIYLDTINNTNTRQRYINRLIEKLTKNNYQLEKLNNRLDYINNIISINYETSDIANTHTEELKRIYKQQLSLRNKNVYIQGRIDNKIKYDAINNTNIRRRQIDRLAEQIARNNNQLVVLDNRLNYINQIKTLDNRTAFLD
jgi:hypothetical protein